MKITLCPSVLAADFSKLGEQLRAAEAGGADWLHLDVMDGHFVPNISFGPPVIEAIRPLTKLPFDVHLMIEDPDRYLEAFRASGADRITVHQETCRHLHRTVARIRELGASPGICINPATPVSVLAPIVDQVDLILVMSVNPGFGGQKFIAGSYDKLRQVRALTSRQDLHIQIDGGIDASNIHSCVDAGANTFVAGTSVFRAPDVAAAVRRLRSAATTLTT